MHTLQCVHTHILHSHACIQLHTDKQTHAHHPNDMIRVDLKKKSKETKANETEKRSESAHTHIHGTREYHFSFIALEYV